MAKKQAAAEAPVPTPDKLAIEHWPVAKLKPYKRNAKQHPPDQIAMIARLIEEHGFDVPIVVNRKGVIVKGHGRWMAAKQLGLETVPVIAKDFTPAQEAAARIADNRVGEFGWDFDALVGDVVAGLKDGLDMTLTGFTLKDLGLEHDASGAVLHTGDPVEDAPVYTGGVEGEENYTRKIEAPIYEPKEKSPPPLERLFNTAKTEALSAQIERAKVPEDVKAFLQHAAQRHTVFDYGQIAEYYAHAPAEVQELMEQSALVIIDFKKAIENGFAVMTKEIAELAAEQESEQ